jgi:hypothetical protein
MRLRQKLIHKQKLVKAFDTSKTIISMSVRCTKMVGV